MCRLKKHIFKLALLFNQKLSKSLYHSVIIKACIEKNSRFSEDNELKQLMINKKNTMKFMDLKKLKDDNYEDFKSFSDEIKFIE